VSSFFREILLFKEDVVLKHFPALALLLAVLFVSSALFASPVTIDFDGLSDATSVTTQFTGLIFSNAIVLTAGISLNELDFPPVSGNNVVSDDGGPMFISFASPIDSFYAFFTYTLPLSLQGLDAGNNVIATSTSALSSNYVSSGKTPNELLQITFAPGISKVRISGDPLGSSFSMDSLSYNPKSTTTPVPEPSSLYLLLSGMTGLFLLRRTVLSSHQ
jgi:hypothetical protein